MMDIYRKRRVILALLSLVILAVLIIVNTPTYKGNEAINKPSDNIIVSPGMASEALDELSIKGRAPKTGYSREQFGKDWARTNGCDTRNIILNRDLTDVKADEKCNVISGILNDPYTGKTIEFVRGSGTSEAVQIDHVVALSDAWQKGAQYWVEEQRITFANDPLELLAVDGSANQQKGGSDAASWLPPNKPFRCQYIARQVAIKQKYKLWVTQAEHDAMANILDKCPGQLLPSP